LITNNPTYNKNYIPGINGCRALACIGVFVVNYLNKVSFNSSWENFDIAVISGRFGIVTLIVLSGFGLSIPFWRSLMINKPLPLTWKFLARRFFRIAPLYYICLTVLIFHNELWKENGGWEDILLHFSFLYNYSSDSFYSINPVFWVLAYFMHFYLLLPILFLIGKKGVKTSCIVFFLVIIASYFVHSYLCSIADPFDTYIQNLVYTKSFFAYLPHFLIGTLLACFYLRHDGSGGFDKPKPKGRGSFWIIMAVLILVLGTPLALYGELPFAVYHFPVTPILIGLLILSAANGSGVVLLESPPMKTLAVLSYGIFVFHYPVINFTLRILPKFSIEPLDHIYLTGITAFLSTVIIAALTYAIVEKPINRMSKRLFI
jgi:peptidoglycan/LPS O-acetylase OafA/YrhL